MCRAVAGTKSPRILGEGMMLDLLRSCKELSNFGTSVAEGFVTGTINGESEEKTVSNSGTSLVCVTMQRPSHFSDTNACHYFSPRRAGTCGRIIERRWFLGARVDQAGG